jgi:hypothetical protein
MESHGRLWRARGPLRLPLLSLLLTGCGGEDGTGPNGDQPPRLTIQEVLIEGAANNDVRVVGTASDDKGLDSLRFSVNGFHQFTRELLGKAAAFDLTAPGQQAGQGTVELIAFDNGGNSKTQSAPFEILEPSPTIQGEVFLVENGAFNPATGKQFCVEDVCDEVGVDGSVLLEGLPWVGSYEIQFIEGANTEFLVVPSKNRLEKNLVNYINTDARAGRVPLDTALVDGVNERRYIFFADRPVPVQDIVDNHTGSIHRDYRFIFLTEEGDTLIGAPGENFKFVYSDRSEATPSDTLLIRFQLRTPLPTQETIDSVHAWARTGINRAQECWEDIWDEPVRYLFRSVSEQGIPGSEHFGHPGLVSLRMNTAEFGYEDVQVWSEDFSSGLDRVRWLWASVNHPGGMPYLKRYLESTLTAIFIGSPHHALGPFNSYMSQIDDPADFQTGWTATDQQACIFLSAFDHKTRFALSEGY